VATIKTIKEPVFIKTEPYKIDWSDVVVADTETTSTATPPKTRREVGKLAQRRRALKAEAEPKGIDVDDPALLREAMKALDGYTYPMMGAQLVLAGAKFGMSRESHAAGKQFVTQVEIGLNKKGGA
jgi:hypothetical protein